MKHFFWIVGVILWISVFCFDFEKDTIGILCVVGGVMFFLFAYIHFEEPFKKKEETKTKTYIPPYNRPGYVPLTKTENLTDTYTPAYNIYVNKDIPKSLTNESVYLFLDVETTGLPSRDAYSPKDYTLYPRIVQFCWMILDRDFNLIKNKNYYVNFGGTVPDDATNINGITTEIMQKKGVPTIDVLKEFNKDLDSVKLVIAHNADFDLSIIQSEFYRNNMKNKLHNFPNYCTMHTTADICKLQRPYNKHIIIHGGGYKYPKLEELYLYCFNNEDYNATIVGSHDAETDVYMTIQSLKYLIKNGLIRPIDLFYTMRHHQKIGNEFSEIIEAHLYILRRLNDIDDLDYKNRKSVIKQINKRMLFLTEKKHVLFESMIIPKIENLINELPEYEKLLNNIALTEDNSVLYEKLSDIEMIRSKERLRIRISKLKNQLNYQSITKQGMENPMPEGLKRKETEEKLFKLINDYNTVVQIIKNREEINNKKI